jgi:hypothetical protein
VDSSPPEAKHHGAIVTLTGSGFVAGSLGEATGTHLNISLSVTEHNSFWFGWASITDDADKERLAQEGKIEFKAE